MKIGELARLSGVTASRIRFYESGGLLPSAGRQANGYREYGPDALTRLAIIDRAQAAGFSLDEIRAVLPPELDEWPHEKLIEVLQRKVVEIEQLEQRLAHTKGHLLELIGGLATKAEGETCEQAARRLLARFVPAPGAVEGSGERREGEAA